MYKCFKIPYNSLGEANKEATRLKGNMKAYQCKRCYKFHLTSMSDKESKSIDKNRTKGNPYFSQLKEEVEFNTELITQLNNRIDQLNQVNKQLEKTIKEQRERFYFRSRLEDEFFKDKPIVLTEWKQLNIDNPFLTEKDFE